MCVARRLCYRRLFHPRRKRALMLHMGFAADWSKICIRVSCFDRLSLVLCSGNVTPKAFSEVLITRCKPKFKKVSAVGLCT